jgi:transposase-like protein
MGPVEIITSVQRRRRWSPGEKKAIVEESEQPGMSISSVARKYCLHPNQLFTWRRLMQEGALSAVRAGEAVVPISGGTKNAIGLSDRNDGSPRNISLERRFGYGHFHAPF